MKEEKQFSFKYILVSALYIVLGLVLLFWPALSVKTICYVLSAIMFVIGIAYIIMNFIRDKDEETGGFLQMDLVIGIPIRMEPGDSVNSSRKAAMPILHQTLSKMATITIS